MSEGLISTVELEKGLTSDVVLQHIRPELESLGFEVEAGKRKEQKIERPVFLVKTAYQTSSTRLTHFMLSGFADLKLKQGALGWEMPYIAT